MAQGEWDIGQKKQAKIQIQNWLLAIVVVLNSEIQKLKNLGYFNKQRTSLNIRVKSPSLTEDTTFLVSLSAAVHLIK